MAAHSRRDALLPLSLIWLAFALRVYRLNFQSLWRDEVDALRFATRALPELLATFRRPGENGPLFFLALRPWLVMVGHSEFALRFPSVLAGVLAAAIAFVLVRRLAGPQGDAALVAMLLTATAPYLVWYGQDAKMYAMLTVLVPLSLWLTVEVVRHGGWWRWCLLYVITTMSIYVHLLAALVVPVQMLWLLLIPGSSRPTRRWLGIAGYLAVLLLPYLPIVRWEAGMWLSSFETGHPFVPLPGILTVLAVAFSQGILPLTAPILLLPATLAFLAGLVLWPAERGDAGSARYPMSGWRTVALLSVWLLLPPLAVYGVSLGMPIFTDRYLIWVAPAFLMLAAMGVVALAHVWRPLGLATLGAVLIVNFVSVWAQTSQPIKSDFRAAAQFVLSHRRPDDLLIYQIPYIRHAFIYYSGEGNRSAGALDSVPAKGLYGLDGPYTNNGMSEASLADWMDRATAQARGVWLIASEVPLWDERDLTRNWLAARGTISDHADFVRVSATRYELKK